MSDTPFRPQAPPRSAWSFQNDSFRGLKTSVQNNQPLLALEYIYRLFQEMQDRIDALEGQMKEKSSQPKAPNKRSEVTETV